MRAVVLVCALAPLLAGCGIPDLTAHTVKAIQRSQRDTAPSTSGSAVSPAPSAAVVDSAHNRAEEAPPPPAPAPVYTAPSRSGGGVTVEELPPR
ncbi:hypothetical protein [Magnetospirillum molischianum]|uniref:hypothetical protein n=1 Tax=Magnetospirillum molischianum TaxID=1083 RepID=UPI0002FBC6B5|nr:hypothetical protein [Magnetospirillum molischianum]